MPGTTQRGSGKESPIVSLVAGVAENGAIGLDGELPWRVKADLRRFRAVTMGKPLIMGRRTFESIGRVLDGRASIVLTRQPGSLPEGVIGARDLADALVVGERLARESGAGEVCVIGGGEVFREAMPFAHRLHVTRVRASPRGDVFFPAIAKFEWGEVSREELPASEGDTASASYVVYERR
jgi:dihydrofolate reductase